MKQIPKQTFVNYATEKGLHFIGQRKYPYSFINKKLLQQQVVLDAIEDAIKRSSNRIGELRLAVCECTAISSTSFYRWYEKAERRCNNNNCSHIKLYGKNIVVVKHEDLYIIAGCYSKEIVIQVYR